MMERENIKARHSILNAEYCAECMVIRPCDASILLAEVERLEGDLRNFKTLESYHNYLLDILGYKQRLDFTEPTVAEKVIELQQKLAQADARCERYKQTFTHMFNNGTGPIQDTCANCGLDLRDEIHKRKPQAGEPTP